MNGDKFLRVAMELFDQFGGVNQHKIGIKKYSSHQIKFIPTKPINLVLKISEKSNSLFQNYLNHQNGTQFRRFWNNQYQKLMNKIGLWEFYEEWYNYGPIKSLYHRFMKRKGLNGFDIVHSHADNWFIKLCFAARSNTCKWVHTYHTLHFKEEFLNGVPIEQENLNKIFIEVASKADFKISVSKWLHDYLLKKYAIETKIIPNGFDLNSCNKAKPERFIRKYAIKDFILYIGSIRAVKNPLLFVKLAKQLSNLKFVMVGRKLDPINLWNKYRVSIPKNLIMLNEISHKDTLDALAACKLFLMTSKLEGFPTALLEAMGLGKIVVVPSHSGCKEIVYNENYGFLYNINSFDDLIEQTKQALESNQIGENARERVLQNYSWEVLIKKIDSIYESCRE